MDQEKQKEVLRLFDGQWPDPFYATPNVVWEQYLGLISPNAFLIYHVYRYYASSHSGKCWPSISMIAKKLGWSWERVRNARNELEEVGLISIQSRGKGRVALITMLRPKPITRHERHPVALDARPIARDDSPIVHDYRGIVADDTNYNQEQEYINDTTTSSSLYVPLLLRLLDRKPMAHEMRKAKEVVDRLPGHRILEVLEWAKTRDSPFGAAIHALREGYPVRPKPEKTYPPGPRWLPPVTRPKKEGHQ